MNDDPFDPILTTQADVETAWRTLIRPLGWSGRRLWFFVVGDDGRPLPILHEVDDVPPRIGPEEALELAAVWRRALHEFAPAGRMALLLCRPGDGQPEAADRSCAAALYAACRQREVALEVIHLATDHDIMPIPADSLPGAVPA